jgi:hypothetical protein
MASTLRQLQRQAPTNSYRQAAGWNLSSTRLWVRRGIRRYVIRDLPLPLGKFVLPCGKSRFAHRYQMHNPPIGPYTSCATGWSSLCTMPIPQQRVVCTAASPYSVRLASATASSSFQKVCIAAIGPKTSSWDNGMSGVTSTRTVGSKKSPLRLPPATTLRPYLRRHPISALHAAPAFCSLSGQSVLPSETDRLPSGLSPALTVPQPSLRRPVLARGIVRS